LSAVRGWWGDHLGKSRWQAELAQLVVDPVFHAVGVPRGDRQTVLLIPGFLAGDPSLSVMADWLARLGYRPRPSDRSPAATAGWPATARPTASSRARSPTRSDRQRRAGATERRSCREAGPI
jgi:hypothetical protein